jgi:hypothetical protein
VRRRSIPALAWLVVAGVVVGYACEPERAERVYYEDFEGELCDGAPCGWARSSGTAEQARWVETIHPGEHGLALTGDVTVRGPGSAATVFGPSILLQMVVRCDEGSRLGVDVVISDELGSRSLGVDAFAPTEWDEVSVTLGSGGEIGSSTITAIVFTKTGSGTCEIGEVIVDDLRFGDDIVC